MKNLTWKGALLIVGLVAVGVMVANYAQPKIEGALKGSTEA